MQRIRKWWLPSWQCITLVQRCSEIYRRLLKILYRNSFPKVYFVGYAMFLMTSSNDNMFRVTGPWWGESTSHRWFPFTKASDAELWYFLLSAPEERLSKQSRPRRFETPSRSLWRYCNTIVDRVITWWQGTKATRCHIVTFYSWFCVLAWEKNRNCRAL